MRESGNNIKIFSASREYLLAVFMRSAKKSRPACGKISAAKTVMLIVTVQPSARFGCFAACFAAKAAKISLLAERHMSKIVKMSLTSKLDGSIFLFLPHG